MIYVGIDPGFGGGIAILRWNLPYNDNLVFDTPTLVVERGGKQRSEYHVAAMSKILREHAIVLGHVTRAAVERVHAMPGAGTSGMFSFGQGYGIWLGLLTALGIPYDLVEPARWKKTMMDGMGKTKDAARFRAQQLFPALADQLKLKKHDGRAEALLIAEYRRRLEGGRP